MATAIRTPWRMAGEQHDSCNCAWGCPCQFNARPTHGHCEAFIGFEIREGHYGDTRLDGVRFAKILRFPGAVHEGNGIRQLIVDERASPTQREALLAIETGTQGGTLFEIFAAVCPTALPPLFAPIELTLDRERRRSRLRIPGIGESEVEPIRNPVTGEEHRARIVLPDGFEYKEAEMGDTVRFWVETPGLAFAHEHCYAQLNAFDWSNGSGAGRP